MKQQIRTSIKEAVTKLYPQHAGIEFSVDFAPTNIDADFASNAAMVLGKAEGLKPGEVAVLLKDKLDAGALGFETSIAMPGFLNFKVAAVHWQEELGRILKAGAKYGTNNINKGKKARVEYVSANPTGPIHIGNARGGPYGEVVCRVLEATGYKVLREYFHNDVGGQIEKLGDTLWYWYEKDQGRETEFPEDGYKGEYPQEIARAALKESKGFDIASLKQFAIDYIFEENLETMKRLGIRFDLIVKESDLQSSGKVAKAVEDIKRKGFTRENEGALWFVHPSLP